MIPIQDKTSYTGEYIKHGLGVFHDLQGGVYEGRWVFDKRAGNGKYTYPNGDVYEGEWLND